MKNLIGLFKETDFFKIKHRDSKGRLGFAIFYPTAFFILSVLTLLGTFNTLWTEYFKSAILLTVINALTVVSGSLFRIPFGILADRRGGRASALVLLSAVLIGFLMIDILLFTVKDPENNMLNYYPVFVIGAFLLGFGGNYFLVGMFQISYWLHNKNRYVIFSGVFMCCAQLGLALTNLIFGAYVNKVLAPQWSFLIFLIISFMWLMAQIILPITPSFLKLLKLKKDNELKNVKKEKVDVSFTDLSKKKWSKLLFGVWRNPKFIVFVLFCLFVLGVLFSTISWTPYILLSQFKLPRTEIYLYLFGMIGSSGVIALIVSPLFVTRKYAVIYFFVTFTIILIAVLILVTLGNIFWVQILADFIILALCSSCLMALLNWAGKTIAGMNAIASGWITGIAGTFGGVLSIVGSIFTQDFSSNIPLRYEDVYWLSVIVAGVALIVFLIIFKPITWTKFNMFRASLF